MIKYCYTLKDVLGMINNPMTYDKDKIVTLINLCLSSDNTELQSILSLHNIDIDDLLRQKLDDGNIVINSTPYSKLLNLIKLRFQEDYIIKTEEEFTAPSYNINELQEWCGKFLEILCYSKDRYVNILNIYDNNIAKLMNPLKTTHTGLRNTARHEDYDTDMSGKNIINDTPQTTDVVATMEQDQYASELSKSTAHTDNIGDVSEAVQDATTTEAESMTTMAKIKEIQDSYDLMLKKWANEFEPLFMEEI